MSFSRLAHACRTEKDCCCVDFSASNPPPRGIPGCTLVLVLAAERATNENLPVIFDITVAKPDIKTEPADWSKIRPILNVLRNLKNRIFENSLTVKCIEMFQS